MRAARPTAAAHAACEGADALESTLDRADVSRARSVLMARSYVHEARRKRVGPKKQRIRPIIERLAVEHADAKIALRFASPLELLVSVMLSAQTTDVNVNRVTEKLFVKYRRPEDYLAVPVEELERDIFATGFYRQKAKSLRGTMQLLIEEYDGEVPTGFDELLRLPGVARKTANVVSAERGNAQGIVVDTHVRRLSQRLGLTRQEDPVKIERDLMRLVPREDWARFPHLLIWHGRRICDARRPRCEECPLAELCPLAALSGVERDEQAAVVVVGGEDVGDDLFSMPARVRIESCSPSRRTPHSRASSTGFGSENWSASTTSRPIRSGSAKPVSSKTPRPIASTRRPGR